MTEEKKEVEKEEEPKEAPEPVEGEEEQSPDKKEEAPSVNYEEIIAKEEGRGKPDPIRAKIALKEREAKREVDEEEEPSDDDKPLTRREFNELVSSQEKKTEKTLNEARATTITESMSESPQEAKAILATWRNREFPQGMPLDEQLEETYVIVNRKRLISKTSEAMRALKARDGVFKDTASTHKDPQQAGEPKLSAADAQGLKSAGYKWDGINRIWKKPIRGGKLHVYMKDLKSPTYIAP